MVLPEQVELTDSQVKQRNDTFRMSGSRLPCDAAGL